MFASLKSLLFHADGPRTKLISTRPSSPATPQGQDTTAPASALGRSFTTVSTWLARLTMIVGPAILLVLVLLRSLYELPLSFPRLAERDQQYPLWLASLALAIGCALPAALMYWVQTRASESLKDRKRFQVPQATSDGGDVPDQHASEVKQLWDYECDQMVRRNDNIALQMNFYGLFATLAVALGAVLLLGRAPLLRYDGSLDAIGAVALAATTAAVTSGCFSSEPEKRGMEPTGSAA